MKWNSLLHKCCCDRISNASIMCILIKLKEHGRKTVHELGHRLACHAKSKMSFTGALTPVSVYSQGAVEKKLLKLISPVHCMILRKIFAQ